MIDVSLTSPNLNALIAELRQTPRIMQAELRAGMREALDVAVGEIQRLTPVDTGAAQDSIDSQLSGRGSTIEGEVFSQGVPYVRVLNDGSRPHVIEVRDRKALRFVVRGRVVFAKRVRHPGTRGVHMFERGMEAAQPKIDAIFEQRLVRVIRRLARADR